MKKISILLLFLLSLLLVGCTVVTSSSNTTTENNNTTISTDSNSQTESTTNEVNTLVAPTNLKIEKGIVSFDLVEGAQSYTLKIRQNGEFIMNLVVNNGDDLTSYLEDGEYTATIQAKAGNKQSESSEEIEFTMGVKIIDITTLSRLSGELLSSDRYVNMSGRHYFNETEGRMYFYYTASGFKVSFTGTKLDATILATGYNKPNNEARIVVLVDGEVYPEGGTTIVLNKAMEATYTLVEGLTQGKHSVEVLKRSEAIDNTLALSDL